MSEGCCAPGRDGSVADAAVPVAAPAAVRPARISTLVELPGGTFLMGSEDADINVGDGEAPIREVTVRPFAIDTVTVTNARWATFVKATGYVTEAERFGWSYVFHLLVPPNLDRRIHASPAGTPWWLPVPGANWRSPEGPGSTSGNRQNHPVVHISWNDANAYCEWSATRLPTEAEWEYAARGGLESARYPWGDELLPGGRHRCNIWQGVFPDVNTADDGWVSTAPVTTFQPNGFGLYNVSGNVWEWCADWFSSSWHLDADRVDPQGPPTGTARAMRGGSFLCHHSYCNRYRVAARTSNTPDSSASNIGFRVVRDHDSRVGAS
jgi:formylglycine-generating enzyme